MSDTADFIVRICPPDTDARVLYDGPVPEDLHDQDWDDGRTSYVYMFLRESWALYIGMSKYPGRWHAHCGRNWFDVADQLIVIRMWLPEEWRARKAAFDTERLAIQMFGPTFNIAGKDAA